MRSIFLCFMLGLAGAAYAQQDISVISIPPQLSYLLDEPFEGNISENFIDTRTSNNAVNAVFAEARNATAYSYDQEFTDILGSSPTIQLIESRDVPFAYETGAWDPDHNQVWFTSSVSATPTYFSILHLNNYTITTPDISLNDGPNLNGGYYFNGLQYFTIAGNQSASIPVSPGIVSVDPSTLLTSRIIDSYYGVPLSSVDDMTWVKPNLSIGATSCIHNETNMFFTRFIFPAHPRPLSHSLIFSPASISRPTATPPSAPPSSQTPSTASQ